MGEIRDKIRELKETLEQICTDAQSPSAELSEASIRREFKNSFPPWLTGYDYFYKNIAIIRIQWLKNGRRS
jgi:hypothetical protein